jgi:outer membrane protein assembly factor BamD (BamD/ComL family)
VDEPEVTEQAPTVLAQELGRLEEVRQAMAQGRAARALELLGRYNRDFASGSMSSEAAALRVEALVRAGRHEEAREAARAFLAKYPRSPLSDRVRVAAGL